MTTRPVHLVAQPGDRRVLCGAESRRGPVLPYRLVGAPPRTHGEHICPACVAAL